MRNLITQQLRAHLNSITKEQFAAEWSAILDLGLGGPCLEDVTTKNTQWEGSTNVKCSPPLSKMTIMNNDDSFAGVVCF